MGWFLLAVSLALTAASCRAGMRLLARLPMDRFWVRVLIVPTQLGAAALITSAFGAFSPVPFLGAQAVIAGGLWLVWLRWGSRSVAEPAPPRTPLPADPAMVVMGLLLAALLIAGVVHTCLLPLFGIDERMYHASRVAYWLQNRSILFYETHNDRQVSFPFGAELFFAWPLLFVKHEVVGRLFHWLAVPLACAGVASVCRAIGLSRRSSLAGALVYAATPTMLFLGSGLKSDIWQPVYLLGIAYYLLQPRPAGRATWMAYALAGAMFALAMNVKMTALGMAPGLLVAAWTAGKARECGRRVVMLAMGTFGCACVCGLFVMLVSNLVHYGRPLGPQWIGKAVSANISRTQVYVHAARTVVFLIEIPEIPSEGLRQAAEKAGTRLTRFLRADKALDLENNPVWPGLFRFAARHSANNYSLWGMFWLPGLAIGGLVALREARRSWPRLELSRPALLLVMQAPLFLGVVFLIRWMGDGPSRFWVGVFALFVPVGMWLMERWTARSGIVAGVAFTLLCATAIATLRGNIQRLDWHVLHPLAPVHIEDRMHEVIPLIPERSTVLLVASEATRDYGLFNPRRGFCNTVYSWGRRAFTPSVAQGLIDKGVTHVVIENDTQVAVAFLVSGAEDPRPLVDTRPLVEWMKQRPDFREVPLTTPNVRLFARETRPVGGGS
jgi:hypothetical protein